MNPAYIYEFFGTFILVLLGNGVVANSLLTGSKGEGAGWLAITFGWGFAVFLAVTVAAPYSGAHVNPAVTIGLAMGGLFDWAMVPGYVISQILGGFVGAITVYLFFKRHFDITKDSSLHLACFSTSPAIRNKKSNFFSEFIGTFILVILVFFIAGPSLEADNLTNVKIGLGTVGALPIAIVVVSIGLSLGGTTGYAINPARDLGPRIAYSLLPFKNKTSADWSYSWIPVLGPIAGAIFASVVFLLLQSMSV